MSYYSERKKVLKEKERLAIQNNNLRKVQQVRARLHELEKYKADADTEQIVTDKKVEIIDADGSVNGQEATTEEAIDEAIAGEPEKERPTEDELAELTVRELKKLAASRQHEGYSNLLKAELIDLLS